MCTISPLCEALKSESVDEEMLAACSSGAKIEELERIIIGTIE